MSGGGCGGGRPRARAVPSPSQRRLMRSCPTVVNVLPPPSRSPCLRGACIRAPRTHAAARLVNRSASEHTFPLRRISIFDIKDDENSLLLGCLGRFGIDDLDRGIYASIRFVRGVCGASPKIAVGPLAFCGVVYFRAGPVQNHRGRLSSMIPCGREIDQGICCMLCWQQMQCLQSVHLHLCSLYVHYMQCT